MTKKRCAVCGDRAIVPEHHEKCFRCGNMTLMPDEDEEPVNVSIYQISEREKRMIFWGGILIAAMLATLPVVLGVMCG